MRAATAVREPAAVYDREQLVALARLGHVPILPSLESWKAMAAEDRRTLIAAALAYGEERVRGAERERW